ncbi:hypothetical protein NMG60_11035511 [Bertholletia excelsa]
MVRTPCCDKNGLKKGTWTPEEDRKLKAYINKYGCWNWRQLPKFAGLSRCGKSCRLRWMNYLRPNIKRGNFSKEEENLILELHESLGNRWSAIAAKLPGRTDNEIKNHWHTYLKKRFPQNSSPQVEQQGYNNITRSKHRTRAEKTPRLKSNPEKCSPQQIIESSQFSPFPSSRESSSSASGLLMEDAAPTNSASSVAENHVSLDEIFAEATENFWSEPFLVDNFAFDSTISDVLAPFVDTGFLPPHSPVISEEFLPFCGFYDEFNDVLIL